MQNLYDEHDVLSDNNILLWYKKLTGDKQDPLKSKIVTKLKPFIDWLQESDSESESD